MTNEELQNRCNTISMLLGSAHVLSLQMLECGEFPPEQKDKFTALFNKITNAIDELYYKGIATDTEAESAGNKVYNKFEEAIFGLKDK